MSFRERLKDALLWLLYCDPEVRWAIRRAAGEAEAPNKGRAPGLPLTPEQREQLEAFDALAALAEEAGL